MNRRRRRFLKAAAVAGAGAALSASLPKVLAAFPRGIRSASVARPTLADVFLRRAGRRFHAEKE